MLLCIVGGGRRLVGRLLGCSLGGGVVGWGGRGRRTAAQRTAFRLVFISEKGYESS